jgi:transcriptional regulator with XRE-family HTH domain
MISNLGKIIKEAKELKEIMSADLEEFTGVSEEKIEEIEANTSIPNFDTAFLIVRFLEIDVDWRWLRLITDIANDE